MNKALLEIQERVLCAITLALSNISYAVKRCIAISSQLPNIARVFEPTVYIYTRDVTIKIYTMDGLATCGHSLQSNKKYMSVKPRESIQLYSA